MAPDKDDTQELVDEAYLDWLNERLNQVSSLVADIVERMLAEEDDRVTILGMIQSATMHGLHDGGFSDETE